MQGGAQGKKIRAAQAAGDVLVLLCMPRNKHRGALLALFSRKTCLGGFGGEIQEGRGWGLLLIEC